MLKSFLFSIDLYGIEYTFREKSDTKYHTIQGCLLSILSYVAIIVICILFGKDIFVYKIPSVNSGEKVISVDESRINLSNFPIVFYFENGTDLTPMDPTNYYKITYKEYRLNENNEVFISAPKPITFIKCNFENIENRYIVNGSIASADNFCLDFNNTTIFNSGDNVNSFNLIMDLKRCDIKTNPNCKNPFEYSDTMHAFIYTIQNTIDPENYENPLTFRSVSTLSRLSNKAMITNRLGLRVNRIETDVGKIFDEIKIDNYITSTPIEQNLVLYSTESKDPIHFRMNIRSSIISNVITRRYMKIQELLSRIGGIANAIAIFGYLIINSFNYFSFINEINNELNIIKDEISRKENLISYENMKNINNRVDSNLNLNDQNEKSSQILNNISSFKNNLFEKENHKIEKKQSEENEILKKGNTILKLNEENLASNSSNKDYVSITNFNSFVKEIPSTMKCMIDENNSLLKHQFNESLKSNFQKLLTNDEDTTENYLEYFFKLIFCCKSTNVNRKKVFDEILSLHSFLKTNYSSKILLANIAESN